MTPLMNSKDYPPSDAAIPLRTKFRLWIAAIVADEARNAEEERVSAIDPHGVTEPGREYPEPEPPPLSEAHPEYDPTPDD